MSLAAQHGSDWDANSMGSNFNLVKSFADNATLCTKSIYPDTSSDASCLHGQQVIDYFLKFHNSVYSQNLVFDNPRWDGNTNTFRAGWTVTWQDRFGFCTIESTGSDYSYELNGQGKISIMSNVDYDTVSRSYGCDILDNNVVSYLADNLLCMLVGAVLYGYALKILQRKMNAFFAIPPHPRGHAFILTAAAEILAIVGIFTRSAWMMYFEFGGYLFYVWQYGKDVSKDMALHHALGFICHFYIVMPNTVTVGAECYSSADAQCLDAEYGLIGFLQFWVGIFFIFNCLHSLLFAVEKHVRVRRRPRWLYSVTRTRLFKIGCASVFVVCTAIFAYICIAVCWREWKYGMSGFYLTLLNIDLGAITLLWLYWTTIFCQTRINICRC